MLRFKKITLGSIILMFLFLSCKKENGITTPISENFKQLVQNKTFSFDGVNIEFNASSFPIDLVEKDGRHDDKDEKGKDIIVEIKTIIFSSLNGRVIYQQSLTIEDKDNKIVKEEKAFIGYELKDNGGILYKTEIVPDNVDDIKWENSKLLGVLSVRLSPLTSKWSEISKRAGYYLSKTRDNYGDYYGLKIGDNAGEMYIALSSKVNNVKESLDRDNTSEDVSKLSVYKNNNRYIVIKDASIIIDITLNANNTITMVVDKDTGASLVLEKYDPDID